MVFKGSGFYRNDSREASKATASSGSSNGSAKSGESNGSSSSSRLVELEHVQLVELRFLGQVELEFEQQLRGTRGRQLVAEVIHRPGARRECNGAPPS